MVQIAIASGDSANALASALKAQVDAQPDLPLGAGAVGAVVTLTAKNKGAIANGIKVSASVTATGVTAVATAMTGGATDPTLATALAVVFSAGHNIIASPYADATNLAALRDHLDVVGNGIEKRGAFATVGFTGTLSAATTAMIAANPKRITGILVPNTTTPAYEVAAIYAAICAFEEDPAMPLNTLVLPGVIAPPLANQLGRTEQENCLYNGVTPTEVGPGNVVQIVRAITGYTKDPQGVDDISLLDLTTIRTLDYSRKAWVDRISLRFPRSKKSKRVKKRIRDELLDVAYKLQDLEILENIEENEDGFLVEDDLQDPNRANCRMPADVVNGLHVVAMSIDLIL
jgi:phage tail sheath gpL-like